MSMKNYRHGKFRFSDYYILFLTVLVCFIFMLASVMMHLPVLYVIIPAAYALVLLWVIIDRHIETFIICNDLITVFKWGRRTHNYVLPTELTIVVSYDDVCSPYVTRTNVRTQKHISRDKYAISILHGISLNVALEVLHQNRIKTYTTSTIRTLFGGHHYIYSFVCNQSLLDMLIADRKCMVIIPEALLEEIRIDPSVAEVYIDRT